MAEPHPHHSDVIEDNIDTHPVKLAIGVGIGAISLIVGIMMLAQFAIGAYGTRSMKDDPTMSDAAVRKRIAPVANIAIDPNAPAPAPAAATAASAPVAPAAVPVASTKAEAGGSGKATYESTCKACHESGLAGAPKFGDKAAWSARLKAGKDALYTSALKGKGAMPPKGGNLSLPEADIKAAVDYMLAAAK